LPHADHLRPLRSAALLAALAALTLTAAGCQSVYYDAMELVGSEKRDLLRSELIAMVSDQEDAEEAFVDALTRIKALTGFDGDDLESEYDGLRDAYEDAADAVSDIDDRMDEIETVSADLFEEWEGEVAEIESANLKQKSRTLLRDTRSKYDRMHRSLVTTRGSMDPVLAVLKDHVLFLKANLNAAAIGSIGDEMANIESEIEDLKRSIQQSIAEAERFLEAMSG